MLVNKRSFTIVELLVVMAVIGILLSLAVVGIQAIQKQQRETQRLANIRDIQGAIESFYAKYKFYPRMVSTIGVRSSIEFKGASGPGWVSAGRVCISSPDDGNFYNCTTASSNGSDGSDKPFKFIDTQGGSGVYAIDENTSLTYNNMDCNSNTPIQQNGNGLTGGKPSADEWGIFYKSKTATPQEYALFACTENGKSINYGTLNN